MRRLRIANIILASAISMALLLTSCSSGKFGGNPGATAPQTTNQGASDNPSSGSGENGGTAGSQAGTGTTAPIGSTAQGSQAPQIDLSKVKPDESGKIMVVMFHNFIPEFKKGDKQYTTTFDSFRTLLNQLYTSGYSLISLNNYLDNNINVPAGRLPMVFTFDDGTEGQFNLVDDNGVLKANPDSAVGIMEEFNKSHPDFGLKGTFFVNLGNQTFKGAGTLQERLRYLVDEGFEIGNHTYSHVNLKKITSADVLQQEIGGNQKKMYELIPGYTFRSFSLPYGLPSKELQQYVVKGQYEGVSYKNDAIMEVGWDPAPSPVNQKFNPLSVHRVRASGIEPVDADLAWWLKNLSREKQYVSDGNPDTVTVPKASENNVDPSKLNGRKLVTY